MISVGRSDALKLLAFCLLHDTQWFMAKDEGAYVGASVGAETNCIYYFPGCDPKQNEGWYETCREQFGGDDFGEMLPMGWLKKVEADPTITRVNVHINDERLWADFMRV